ncbi:MAG: GAF domain-containing sensor histidine kinase [Chloroflexi bacterium]|nr:GAF domain-containing sensor histidine kinase [Chloroflexota bacterium]
MTRQLGRVVRKSQRALAAAFALATLAIFVRSAILGIRSPCPGEATLAAAPCASAVEFLVPLFVAFGFWALGVAIWLAARRGLPLVFFALVADILATGMLAGTGGSGDGSQRIFETLLAFSIPLTWQFHHSLLERPPRRAGRIVSATLYALAVALSLAIFLWPGVLQDQNELVILRAGTRLGVVAAWTLGWLLLFANYRRASPQVRGRIRLVTFGTLFAFGPLIFLSLLPETSGVEYYLPYELTMPWLLLSPLAYTYTLLHHRFARSEIALNRAGVYYLLVLLFLSVYMISAATTSRLAAGWRGQWFFIGGGLSVALLLLFAPIKRAFERLMAWVLYGGEITYLSVVARLSESLSTTLDRQALLRLLTEEFPSIMRLARVALVLVDDEKRLTVAKASGFAALPSGVPGDGALAAFLMKAGIPLRTARLRRGLAGSPLGAEEQALLAVRDIAYWVPLISGDALQGLLLVGPRFEDDPFTGEDERILATLSRQAGIAVHNVRLMEEVRASRQDLARAHQQSLARDERERRELALELHDRAVQQLLGISYQVYEEEGAAGKARTPDTSRGAPPRVRALETIRCEIVEVVTQLRGLIGELRPPELEDMGLAAAIEGYVSRLEQKGGDALPEIELDLEPTNADLPDPAKVCLFRAAQEALRNAVKHSEAERIRVRLQARDGTMELVVEDDGRGFRVPERLSELASRDHFGLTGIAERAAWAGGQLDIQSAAGSGTTVRVRVPIDFVGNKVWAVTPDDQSSG